MSEQDAGPARPARTRKELRAAAARARKAAADADADVRALLDAAQDLPAVAGAVPHPPTRPGWHCERCDVPWPCDTARMQLAEQYGADRVGLSMHLGGRMSLAVRELPNATPGELFERFVRWTR